ncbi:MULTISPECIES: RNA polymerase sigma factor [unclassified Sinorhizobium]|uniref:RNA polymerase sigma factor n=1 Tax=unclassified Sinorhizobium TaxID=2613772 RepID=UPI003526709F
MSQEAQRAAERVARQSYGKLIAFLAARSRDVPAAEDALSDALAAALRTWPDKGVPDNPEAWLLVAARRNLFAQTRHRHVQDAARDILVMAVEEAEDCMSADTGDIFPDERIKLLFACTHPALDGSVHTPLMLQTVLGLDARSIARAFVISPEAMSQRLVRAKTKIRDAGIPFSIPDTDALPSRLSAVLSAVYAAYGLGWDGLDGEDSKRNALAEEAIWLGRAVLSTLPREPEAIGLLSLMLYCEARRNARRDGDGAYVPLDEQDPDRWNAVMIAEADSLLRKAGTFNRFGRFQCQAAIQSVHAARRLTGKTDWPALVTFYDALVLMMPTLGALVSQAAVIGRAEDAAAGLRHLDRMNQREIVSYQPYWAVRAHLLTEAGDHAAAVAAYNNAIGLSESPAVRRFLYDRMLAAKAYAQGSCSS